MPSRIFKFRENINLRIFSSKAFVIKLFRVLSFFVFVAVIASGVYFYGFPKTPQSLLIDQRIIGYSLTFFVFRYLIYIFYDFHPVDFLRKNRMEGIVLLFFIIYVSFPKFFNSLIFEPIFNDIVESHSHILFQVYFISIFIVELGKSGPKLTALNLRPTSLLILSFMVLIGAGTGLLMLPEMTTTGHISFLDSLFTSTSASCVTGLIVVDTATFFTLKGKLIIMLLIQLGGINIISFATFFVTFSKSHGNIKYQSLIKDFLSADRLSDTKHLLRSIVLFSLLSEAIGTVLIYFSWGNFHFSSWHEQMFDSLFHAISAFNNAGFSTFSNNLFESGIRNLYAIQIVVILLIFFGGFGFMAMEDIFSWSRIKERRKMPWKRLNISTKVTLYMSLSLITLGAIIFYLLEKNTLFAGENPFQIAVTSIFQSVTTRTAGFNTVDISTLKTPVLIMFIFLMFVGAGSGSTGGGIKVTTFAVIVKSALATIKGEKHVVFYKRTVPFSAIDRAYSIALFSITIIFVSAFLLSITEPNVGFLKLLFEEFSAFGTVGLSTGITPLLSSAGKTIIITSMFVGRIGSLTLAMALSTRVLSTNFKYAESSIIVG
ncbi:MAG: ATPase [Bacteroidales bacterium]|nr:ATPase [Bacteroidales bacterium]